jgi:hypothetical protein
VTGAELEPVGDAHALPTLGDARRGLTREDADPTVSLPDVNRAHPGADLGDGVRAQERAELRLGSHTAHPVPLLRRSALW